jgi:hypothetical protein
MPVIELVGAGVAAGAQAANTSMTIRPRPANHNHERELESLVALIFLLAFTCLSFAQLCHSDERSEEESLSLLQNLSPPQQT